MNCLCKATRIKPPNHALKLTVVNWVQFTWRAYAVCKRQNFRGGALFVGCITKVGHAAVPNEMLLALVAIR